MLEETAVLIFGTLFYVGALVLTYIIIREAHRIIQGALDDRRIRRHRDQMRALHDALTETRRHLDRNQPR